MTFEHYAESVGFEWGAHQVPCPCGQTAKLVLNFSAAVVRCEACKRFETHRRRYNWDTTRMPTGGVSERTLDEMDRIWRRTVPIKGTIGERIFNLTHRTWFGAEQDVDYHIDDMHEVFRYHPHNKSVCCFMQNEGGFVCGVLQLFIRHKGWIFYEEVTGERGAIWPSLELLTRESIGTAQNSKPRTGDVT